MHIIHIYTTHTHTYIIITMHTSNVSYNRAKFLINVLSVNLCDTTVGLFSHFTDKELSLREVSSSIITIACSRVGIEPCLVPDPLPFTLL